MKESLLIDAAVSATRQIRGFRIYRGTQVDLVSFVLRIYNQRGRLNLFLFDGDDYNGPQNIITC